MADSSLVEILDSLPKFKNEAILKSFIKSYSIINRPTNKKILCSISGGADSDVMLDLIYRVDVDKKVEYVWFDTGLEYHATRDHLEYLEKRYGIQIQRERATKPIPLCVKEYGEPFLSKFVSQSIEALQRYDFAFEDEPYDKLIIKYPKIPGYLKWWCNEYPYKNSIYNINYHKYLKCFLMNYPPEFKISAKCCKYAKKNVSDSLIKSVGYDLVITGIRKAEGGIRSAIYKNCYSEGEKKYRPLFWFTNDDRYIYEKAFNIKHSNCYTRYGFSRTGCVGCPYNRNLLIDLSRIKRNEPRLYNAASNVFANSYEYTSRYRRFVRQMKNKEKGRKGLFD